jgi:hypothetical protein
VKTLWSGVAVLALVSFASANQWQIEVADTSGSWTKLQLSTAPDGVVHLFYCGSDLVLRHAYKDSLWHHETVDTFPSLAGWDMDIGSHNELGLALDFRNGSVGLLVRQDAGWVMDSVPITAASWDAILSWDSAGNPAVAYVKSKGVVGFAGRSDSGWVCDTITIDPAGSVYVRGLVQDAQDDPCVMVWYNFNQGNVVLQYTRQDTSWFEQTVDAPTWRGSVQPKATARDPGGMAAVCDNWTDYYGSGGVGFRYATVNVKSSIEDSTQVQVAALAISATGERHVTYLDQNTNGPLKHARSAGDAWVKDTVFNGNIDLLGGIDLLNGLPIIAFYEPGAGICVAGILLPGISDRPLEVGRAAGQASVLNPRSLMVAEPGFVLDLSGRNVLTLHPGTNDVRALAPGVYFVREAQAQAQAVRKIVLTE